MVADRPIFSLSDQKDRSSTARGPSWWLRLRSPAAKSRLTLLDKGTDSLGAVRRRLQQDSKVRLVAQRLLQGHLHPFVYGLFAEADCKRAPRRQRCGQFRGSLQQRRRL